MWARIYALTTSEASVFAKSEFQISLTTFRIMTPSALQWTAFEKHRRADPRAIMYGVLLDIEYKSLCLYFSLLFSLHIKSK
jgi:hypothetical protein